MLKQSLKLISIIKTKLFVCVLELTNIALLMEHKVPLVLHMNYRLANKLSTPSIKFTQLNMISYTFTYSNVPWRDIYFY